MDVNYQQVHEGNTQKEEPNCRVQCLLLAVDAFLKPINLFLELCCVLFFSSAVLHSHLSIDSDAADGFCWQFIGGGRLTILLLIVA
mmetsp:Transcript_4165/g.6090  ORF Transcript_4165/g.6090 Transcript_4165/m.6090 type:complete len:86 (-) Transcript_4165:18-275(-)